MVWHQSLANYYQIFAKNTVWNVHYWFTIMTSNLIIFSEISQWSKEYRKFQLWSIMSDWHDGSCPIDTLIALTDKFFMCLFEEKKKTFIYFYLKNFWGYACGTVDPHHRLPPNHGVSKVKKTWQYSIKNRECAFSHLFDILFGRQCIM